MIAAETDTSTVLAAVVRAADGVRFVAEGQGADEVAAALVSYVRRRCDDVLWPSVAPRVRALLEARRYAAAIAAYFENVGSRWDAEWLEICLISRRCDLVPCEARAGIGV
jgi:hypothetical protein